MTANFLDGVRAEYNGRLNDFNAVFYKTKKQSTNHRINACFCLVGEVFRTGGAVHFIARVLASISPVSHVAYPILGLIYPALFFVIGHDLIVSHKTYKIGTKRDKTIL